MKKCGPGRFFKGQPGDRHRRPHGRPDGGGQAAGGGGEDAEPFPAGGCSAGVAGLTILADGVVVPCRRLAIPLGQVGQESLRKIWATSPVLEALRDKSRYWGKCGACPRWAHCRGCRAIAYEYARAQGKPDFLAPDPQCFIDESTLSACSS